MDAKMVLGAQKITAILKALKKFGYETLTEKDVIEQASKALAGQQVDVGPGMMIRDMLKEEGWIK